MRKILALLLALVMVFSLALTAFAAEGDGETPAETTAPTDSSEPSEPVATTTQIVIQNANEGSTYTAYQLFRSGYFVDENGNETLPNIYWGDDIIENRRALLNDLIEATKNEEDGSSVFDDALKFMDRDDTTYEGWNISATAAAEALKKIDFHKNKEIMTILRKHMYTGVTGTYKDGTYTINSRLNAQGTSVPLPSGYYLIEETITPPAEGSEGVKIPETNRILSQWMLQAVGDVAVENKSEEITILKWVADNDYDQADSIDSDFLKHTNQYIDFDNRPELDEVWQSDWQDVADLNIGSKFWLATSVLLPNLTDFPYYNILVTDEVPEGITINSDIVWVDVYYTDGNTKTYEAAEYKSGTGQTDPFLYTMDGGTIKVFPNKPYTPTGGSETPADTTYGGNIKALSADVESGADVERFIIYYGGTLNNSAVIGHPGNIVKANVQFSRDPNGDAYGVTPWDHAVVFTYQLNIEKIDSVDPNKKLEGAVFVLSRDNTKGERENVLVKDGKVYGYSLRSAVPEDYVSEYGAQFHVDSLLTSDENGMIYISGLDDGTYSLGELAPPEGYNWMGGSITVEIEAGHWTLTDWNSGKIFDGTNSAAAQSTLGIKLTQQGEAYAGTGEGDATTGIVKMQVLNSTGIVLPETGGVGTTLFYILGGLMVVGAAVILVTKRRMAA